MKTTLHHNKQGIETMNKQAIFHREGRTINIILHDFTSAKLRFNSVESAKLVNTQVHEVLEHTPELLTKSAVEDFIACIKTDIVRSNR